MQEKELPAVMALSYLGDAVYSLYVRERLVGMGVSHAGELNRLSLDFVTAPKQAELAKRLLPLLTEEETDVFKRGKNSHLTPPKSASLNEYKRATGFECVFGFLHLTGNFQRIDELFRAAYGEEMARLKENDRAE